MKKWGTLKNPIFISGSGREREILFINRDRDGNGNICGHAPGNGKGMGNFCLGKGQFGIEKVLPFSSLIQS
jgi:hypothetical protein